MIAYQTMLVLSSSTIDEKIISPLRGETDFKLNEWRNLVAQAIGFSTYHELMKREFVVFASSSLNNLLGYFGAEKLDDIVADLCTWYVPPTVDSSLYVVRSKVANCFLRTLCSDDGRGLWSNNHAFYDLGKICMSKTEAERFIDDLNELDLDPDDEPDLQRMLENYEYEERCTPHEIWLRYSENHSVHDELLKSRSKKQLYSKVADYIGNDGDSWPASWGFTTKDFVEFLLNDDSLEFTE